LPLLYSAGSSTLAAAVPAVVVVAAVVAAAEEAVDITAHLAGTSDRLTVNWHWRLIGLLWKQQSINGFKATLIYLQLHFLEFFSLFQ
jgi:hypothetical protein